MSYDIGVIKNIAEQLKKQKNDSEQFLTNWIKEQPTVDIQKYEEEIRADAIHNFVEWLDENYEVEVIKSKVFYKGGDQHRIEINPHDLTDIYFKDLAGQNNNETKEISENNVLVKQAKEAFLKDLYEKCDEDISTLIPSEVKALWDEYAAEAKKHRISILDPINEISILKEMRLLEWLWKEKWLKYPSTLVIQDYPNIKTSKLLKEEIDKFKKDKPKNKKSEPPKEDPDEEIEL